jgi:hypothetical protein
VFVSGVEGNVGLAMSQSNRREYRPKKGLTRSALVDGQLQHRTAGDKRPSGLQPADPRAVAEISVDFDVDPIAAGTPARNAIQKAIGAGRGGR